MIQYRAALVITAAIKGISPGADSGLVKLVEMTSVFFNNQQHKIIIKRFSGVKQITPSFFTNS